MDGFIVYLKSSKAGPLGMEEGASQALLLICKTPGKRRW